MCNVDVIEDDLVDLINRENIPTIKADEIEKNQYFCLSIRVVVEPCCYRIVIFKKT